MGLNEQVDAIQSDVPAETEVVTLTSPESPRMKAMAAIEEARRQVLETELDGQLAEPEAKDDDPGEAHQSEAEANDEPGPIPEKPRFRVKVDGVEKEVDQDDLIRAYQKHAAADHRLEEATRILREAQEHAQSAIAAQPEPVEQVVDLKQEAAGVFAKLYEGDEAAAAEALVNLLEKQKGGDRPTQHATPQIDESVLTQRVLEQIAINQAFEKVKTDYPEIINSRRLETLAAMEIDERVAAGEPRSQAMLTVCDSLYRELGKTPGRPQAEEKPASKREQNKARLDTVPTASAAAVTPRSEQPDVSSVIAQMAARRLGQSMPAPNS